MDLKEAARQASILASKLRSLITDPLPPDPKAAELLAAAATTLRNLISAAPIEAVEEQQRLLLERVTASLESRRESLHAAAREKNIFSRRLGDADKVDVFRVTYRGPRVTLKLGSETAGQFEETDGRRLLESVLQRKESLERAAFSRERFFDQLKVAYRLSRSRAASPDAFVPIRSLYASLVAVRQLDDETFTRAPGAKTFRDYSAAQFVYDFARFGKPDYTMGGEVLRAQPPNMRTQFEGRAMTLPNLDDPNGAESQIAALKISSVEG